MRGLVRGPQPPADDLDVLEVEGTLAPDAPIQLPPLHAGQAPIDADPSRFKVVVAGRRFGKTIWGVRKTVQVGLAGGRAWWVAPTYKLAAEGWDVLQGLAAQIPGCLIRKDEREVWFPQRRNPLRGRVQVRSSDDPNSLRGAGLDYLVFDEFTYAQEEAWTHALRPTLSDSQGGALFIGSANGKGTWQHELWLKGWGATPDAGWKSWQRPTWDNPYIKPEEIEAARADMHPAIFSQEYGAEWIDLAGLVPFRADWFVDYALKDRPAIPQLWISIGVDPAISKRDLACQTALVAIGMGMTPASRGANYVVDADQNHWTPYEAATRIFQWIRSYRPRVLVIEDVAYQRALADILKREAQLLGLPLPRILLQKPELDKLRRAMGASPLVQSGRVQFGPGQEALKAAMLSVPRDKAGWDFTDAFGLALRGLPAQTPLKTALTHEDGTPMLQGRPVVGLPTVRRAAGYARMGGQSVAPVPPRAPTPTPADALASAWMQTTYGTSGRRRAASYSGAGPRRSWRASA